ncbi:MAG: acetylxylan esterase [Victivallales bacterium]
MTRLHAVILSMLFSLSCTAQAPFPIQQEGKPPLPFDLKSDKGVSGTVSLSWSGKNLNLDVRIKDNTPVTLTEAGVGIDEAYLSDSFEFWIGRSHFVFAETGSGLGLWDYLYARGIDIVGGEYRKTGDGYAIKASVPWEAVGVDAMKDMSLQMAFQINDRASASDEKVLRPFFPEGAVFDRPSTYATVFLNTNTPAEDCEKEPGQMVSMDIRQCAYEKKAECFISRRNAYSKCNFFIRVIDDSGKEFRRLELPPGLGEQRILLPWDQERAGIFKVEISLDSDGKLFGPVSEPYFNSGKSPISGYKSPRTAPEDMEKFWKGKIGAMRQRPMNMKAQELVSPWEGVKVEKVTLENHRGNPMTVLISRRIDDEGKRLTARLNVYPPMKSDKPEPPQNNFIGVSFCGSLQGECKLPGQKRNEDLWARAESLDGCYWLDVVLDGIRAMDCVAERSYSNGKFFISGGSRGGWYSLALAATAPDRVILANFASPCYSDVTMNMQLGHSSAAGEIYTVFERDSKISGGRIFQNFRYFDPLFLSEIMKTNVLFSAGLQDNICSAIGMTAAANRMPENRCHFILDSEAGHAGSPYRGEFTQALEKYVPDSMKTEAMP